MLKSSNANVSQRNLLFSFYSQSNLRIRSNLYYNFELDLIFNLELDLIYNLQIFTILLGNQFFRREKDRREKNLLEAGRPNDRPPFSGRRLAAAGLAGQSLGLPADNRHLSCMTESPPISWF